MKVILFVFLFFFLSFLTAETTSFYFETDTRIILVSGENPEDGQLRLFRSAAERHLSPVMLRIKNETYQIREIQKYLNSLSFKDNEISVITPSSNYFATNDPSNLAFNVAKVALVREGSVVMGFPMVKNLSSFSTPFDDSISEVKEKLSELSNPAKNDFHPAPVDLDEWKLSIKILSKYKRLLVKQQQYQLKYASVYDERCCGFAGVTKALKQFFNNLEKNVDSANFGSLKNLCKILAQNETLSYILGVVKDYDALIFKRIDSIIEDVVLVKDPKSKSIANHLHSNSYTYTAFTYSEEGQLPFLLANFASGDVLTPERKNGGAYLDRIIPNLAEYYNGEENFPTVHIIAVISNEKLEKLIDFLRSILTLSYPKEKIYISVVLQGDNKGNHKKELEKMLQTQEVKKYKRIQVFSTIENYYETYQKAWELGKMVNGCDYIFVIHSSVKFTNKNVVEDLLRLNRRVVGPLLESRDGNIFNFKSDQNGKELMDNILAAPFADRYEDFEHQNISLIGLLQVPYIFGAILMKKDVVQQVDFSIDLRASKCEENDEENLQKIETQKCDSKNYDNLHYPELEAWRALCKNINDNGFILYLSNYEKYGFYDFKSIDDNQIEETEKGKIEEIKKEKTEEIKKDKTEEIKKEIKKEKIEEIKKEKTEEIKKEKN